VVVPLSASSFPLPSSAKSSYGKTGSLETVSFPSRVWGGVSAEIQFGEF